MDRRPTIYDVARAAGVATSTVSRTFARPGRVNADTAAKIIAAARELGYRSSSLPGRTRSRTGNIALVVTDITNPFYAEIIRGTHTAAAELGYTMLLSHTQEDAQFERAWIERELASVEGIVLASSRMSDSAIRMLAKQKPLVVLNRRLPEVPSLIIDNRLGMRRALEHLAELGHTSVTYVAGPEASWTDGVRWLAVREAGIALDITVRRVGQSNSPTIHAGFLRAEEIVAHSATAVVAYNDVLAIGVIKGLSRLGVRVPEDISVVGFDNILLAEIIEPELTTVASPLRAQGETSVRNLVAMIGGSVPTGEPLVMPVRLVVRHSTGPVARTHRSRNKTSPALGTTKLPAAASAARSTESGSR
jgi:DNA-binding LacI/PurR family transcriptional regulator